MKQMLRVCTLAFCIAALLLTGCTGEEMFRLPVNAVTTDTLNLLVKESAPIALNKGDKLYTWADMDMEYEGSLALQFSVELVKDGNSIGVVRLDPMNNDMTVNAVSTTFGGKTNTSYMGRMDYIEIPEDGNYVFRSILTSNDNPTLKLNKAELVFKK